MNDQRAKIIKTITIAAVIFLVVMFTALIINLITLAQTNAEKSRLEKQLTELTQIVEDNRDEIAYKKTDEFIEQYAREHLGMKRKDEESFLGK